MSFYADTATPFPPQPPLAGNTHADVCVVGAGYTGLGAALELAQRNVSVVVLEAATVGSAASGLNGGQVHTGQRRDQAWLEKTVGGPTPWPCGVWPKTPAFTSTRPSPTTPSPAT
jgi:gamma-glutamylputrescine oxidase